MLLEQLLFQSLRRIELVDPWRAVLRTPGVADGSLLAGAMVLHFDRTALICTSPLRYSRCQNGTAIALLDGSGIGSMGYRITELDIEDADALLPTCLHRRTIAAKEFLALSQKSSEHPLVLLLDFAPHEETWALRMRLFGVGWYQLTYRPDFGCIELAPVGHHHVVGKIMVTSPEDEFGWLHPASPYPFALDGRCWRSAHPRDWPLPLQRAWRSKPTGTSYRETMRRSLMARFAQHDSLRRRLFALCSKVSVAGVPDGQIEEVAALLRTLHRQRPNDVVQ